MNIDSLLLSLAPVGFGERLHTIFFSLSADCGLCGDGGPLCGSRGGDVDSLIAWLLTNNFSFVFVCKRPRDLYFVSRSTTTTDRPERVVIRVSHTYTCAMCTCKKRVSIAKSYKYVKLGVYYSILYRKLSKDTNKKSIHYY